MGYGIGRSKVKEAGRGRGEPGTLAAVRAPRAPGLSKAGKVSLLMNAPGI